MRLGVGGFGGGLGGTTSCTVFCLAIAVEGRDGARAGVRFPCEL